MVSIEIFKYQPGDDVSYQFILNPVILIHAFIALYSHAFQLHTSISEYQKIQFWLIRGLHNETRGRTRWVNIGVAPSEL